MVSVVAAVVFVCFSVVHTVIIQGPEQWSILLIKGGIDVVVVAVVVVMITIYCVASAAVVVESTAVLL